jgi:hypothetical protein
VASPTVKTGRLRSALRAAKAATPLMLVKARAATPSRSGSAWGMDRMARRGAMTGWKPRPVSRSAVRVAPGSARVTQTR